MRLMRLVRLTKEAELMYIIHVIKDKCVLKSAIKASGSGLE